MFVPANAISLRGNLSGEGSNQDAGARHSYIIRDATGSLFNPFHNFSTVLYEGYSLLPAMNARMLREATDDYPSDIRDTYLQLPPNSIREFPNWRGRSRSGRRIRSTKPSRSKITCAPTLPTHSNLTGKPGEDPLAHFLFRDTRRPLRIFRFRDGYHASHAGNSDAGSERLFAGRI